MYSEEEERMKMMYKEEREERSVVGERNGGKCSGKEISVLGERRYWVLFMCILFISIIYFFFLIQCQDVIYLLSWNWEHKLPSVYNMYWNHVLRIFVIC